MNIANIFTKKENRKKRKRNQILIKKLDGKERKKDQKGQDNNIIDYRISISSLFTTFSMEFLLIKTLQKKRKTRICIGFFREIL